MKPAQTALLSLSKIDLPADARTHDPEKLTTLAQDMKEQGQLQEIVVASTAKGRYEVLAGVGRVTAARKLGWDTIRASVREGISEFDKARITFAENEDREDVDPFYQAMLLAKMLQMKGKTQGGLAKELGISDSLLGNYLAIDKLPAAVKAISTRVEMGQLVQITRINQPKQQIYFAKKCVSQDLSVRDLKARVDKFLKKPRASSLQLHVSKPDPLASLWEKAHVNPLIPTDSWKATYSGKQTWHLTVTLGEGDSRNNMVRWFSNMLKGMPDVEAEEKKIVKRAIKAAQKMTVPGLGSLEGLQIETQPMRLPKTKADWEELEGMAMSGPAMAYVWIYGPGTDEAMQFLGKTWEDLGYKDPAVGVRKIVEKLKQMKSAKTA